MRQTIILAAAFVIVAIGGIALGPPMLAQPSQAASTAQQALSAASPRTTSSTVQQPSTPNITMRQPNDTPNRYLILLDVSGSMAWNLDGEGTWKSASFNCEWGGLSSMPFYAGCSGIRTPWNVESERRIYLAKEMIGKLIDTMSTSDKMEIIAFASGTTYKDNVKVVPSNGWTSDHDILKAELLTVGSYNKYPYITNGGSAQVQALLKAQQTLADAPAPDGSKYHTVAILIADGPANVFANGRQNTGVDTCPDIQSAYKQFVAHCQVGYSDKYQMERPITAMVAAADTIKQVHKVDLYTISMTNTPDDMGMDAVASKPSMAYRYTSPDMLITIMAEQQ